MKILLINTYGSGGAAKACIRLHTGLLKDHVDSVLLLKEQPSQFIPQSVVFQVPVLLNRVDKKTKLKRKAKRILKELYLYRPQVVVSDRVDDFLIKRDKRLEMYSLSDSGLDVTVSTPFTEADIVHLHWVAEFLNYSDFFLKTTKPIVWTLHDMNPFTGGEHYLEEHLGMDEDGYLLKREIADFENKQFEQEIAVKLKALLHKPNLHIVTLCDWMTEEVKNSEVFHGFPVHKIPNGIDKNVFNLKDKTFCREVLGLPHDKIIVLFVADYIENFRKGYAVLLKALELLKHKDIILCSVGNKAGELVSNEHLIELGEIKDERLMSVIYSAADGFVIPSLMDNLPNTVVESLMCGTPVIGFPVGGIKEMIQINENGVLASEISASGLAEAIDLFLSDYMSFDRNIISQNATHKYATEVMVRNYKQLYQSLLTAE